MGESYLQAKLPDPVERPKIARWLWDRNLGPRWLAAQVGVSAEQARRYCLEFGHPDRAIPRPAILAKIQDVTERAILERDFYPPHIRGDDAEARS